MGYACPVCETPRADGRHLANHLAFTAMIHGENHEAWLDEHAPGWEEAGENELAERAVENASEIEFPRSVGDAGEGSEEADSRNRRPHDHQGQGESDEPDLPSAGNSDRGRSPATVGVGVGSDDEDDRNVDAVLAEARELTQRMRNGDGHSDGSGDGGDDREGENGGDDGTSGNDGAENGQ